MERYRATRWVDTDRLPHPLYCLISSYYSGWRRTLSEDELTDICKLIRSGRKHPLPGVTVTHKLVDSGVHLSFEGKLLERKRYDWIITLKDSGRVTSIYVSSETWQKPEVLSQRAIEPKNIAKTLVLWSDE